MVFQLSANSIEYELVSTATADSVALAGIADIAANHSRAQVRVVVTGGAAVIKFGTNGVTASASLTSDARAAGNFSMPAGAIEVWTVPAGTTHVSMISKDGTTEATATFIVGYGE